ncbi:MAG: methylmalonyl-CoA mutase [Ignavibacteria bacterium]|nr:methylmalonyl-CoA mutase [Ignavibacteria bacterium]
MTFQEKKFYTDSDIEIPEYLGEEKAGEFPFTRGIHSSMYRSRLWTMRQYAGFGTAEESNQRYRYLLSQGVTGLSVAFDLPTQIGYDSDNIMSEGEVGKVGVAIDSLADMETLFSEIQLGKISTSMTINATASILLAMYVAVAKKQNANLKKISGTIQNDILKEYTARGTYIYPPKQSMRLITDIFKWCSAELPNWNTISISGYHMREAGCTAVQEVAFTLANGIAYVQAAMDAGLNVDEFASRLSFFFNIHNNIFEEVAKLRAARTMWATIMKERFQAKNENSMKLRFHSQTAGSTLTAQQPENNIVRVTLQTLASVLGGTQSLHTNSFDEALALPTEKSVRIALRTQQIVGSESGVTQTVDPLAGSYYVEYLTSEIEQRAWNYIEKIEQLGGAVKAIEKNFVQTEISNAAYDYQRAIEKKEKIIVGVNDFQMSEPPNEDVLNIDEHIRVKQIARLNEVKKQRNRVFVEKSLSELHRAESMNENLMPHILNCVEEYCTLGEIADTLRNVWGEFQN